MQKSQIDSAALLAVVLAAALALMFGHWPFDWLTSTSGLVLLLILFAYDREGYRTMFQSLAFSAVCGFGVMVTSVVVFQYIEGHPQAPVFDPRLPLTWVGATIILCAIDRARMSSRQEVAPQSEPRALPGHRSFIPEFAPPAPAPSHAAPPVSAPPPPQTPIPVSAAAPPTPPPLAPPPPRPGKETMIYVTLVGEGLNVLRSVKAEHLGRDYYRIIDSMPEGETWEYQSGQVVRCKKKGLSSGKALVAVEEAPRQS